MRDEILVLSVPTRRGDGHPTFASVYDDGDRGLLRVRIRRAGPMVRRMDS